jgi:branched-chain amino acid transport system substrate-binding protein
MRIKMIPIVVAVAALSAGVAYAQDLVVKIGHVGPTSGAIAHLGKDNDCWPRTTLPIRSKARPSRRSWSTRKSTA